MPATTASTYQANLETYLAGTLSMTAYPGDFGSVAQVLAPATEYFSVLVQQAKIKRDVDSNINHVELLATVRLLYRFTTNEDEYTGSATTPTKMKAALKVFMDKAFWNGGGGFSPTQAIISEEDPVSETTRTGRVIETNITVALVSVSV